ncbi:hypothetical protein [Enterobacter cloacae complex sp. 288G10]|uniref:hypothetical protein n=1 Tax=Enterobacter cloacae complex sp. 288G10 TaxID=3395859 RepID=UPI003CE6A88B
MYIEIKETFLELPSEIQFSEAANAAILTQDKWGDVWQTLKTDAISIIPMPVSRSVSHRA